VAWQITPKLIVPKTGAVLKGAVVVAVYADITGADHTEAQVLLTGDGRGTTVIADPVATPEGWLAKWNSATVPNGDYTITVHMSTSNGGVGTSSPVSVQVMN
jgi:hypothetical protein